MRDILSEFHKKHGGYFSYENFVYKNNKQWIEIKCKKGHKYKSQILSHLKSNGCPYCLGIKRDRDSILSELINIHKGMYDYSDSKWVKIDDKIDIICKLHGKFTQSLKLHLKGHKCQKCSNRYKKKNDEYLNTLKNKFIDIDFTISNFINSKTPISAFCKKHGIIKFYPNFKNHVCKKCFQIEKNFNKFKEKSMEKYGNRFDYSNSDYKNNVTDILIFDRTNNIIFNQTPQGHLKGEPHKIFWSSRNNTESFIKESISKHGKKYDYSKVEYTGSKSKVEIICKDHGVFSQTPNNHLRGTGCPSCNRFNIKQNELFDFISEYQRSTSSDRTILDGKEIDIYVPDLKLGFEFNGLYWHSEIYRDKKYHLNKTKECLKKGIQLFHIWEDDWVNKNEIVKSIIINKLKKSPNRIFARNCEVREVTDNNLIKEFLNKNHIQGNIWSKIKLGLFLNNEIVSIMTFGNLRKSLGQESSKGSYEMTRFCNKLQTSVIGGASKLFKYFINNYDFKEIISYSDSSRSNGDLYRKLGFKMSSETPPNYYWIINGSRYHRFNFRKDKLVKEGYDPSKTEVQIMSERGSYRIFDCGNKKWVYSK